MQKNEVDGATYVEPFAGGAGAGLNLLLAGVIENLVINDADRAIFSFWYSLLNNTEEFIKRISDTPVTIEEWKNQKNIFLHKDEHDALTLGFSTFYLNRCNRSGILKANPIGGIKQSGKWDISARYNKDALIKRVEIIAHNRSRISARNEDAIALLKEINRIQREKLFVYLDPPYYLFGQELYMNSYNHSNHASLAAFMQSEATFPWIMTYDDHPEIKALYSRCDVVEFDLNYFAHISRKGREVLIVPKHILMPSRNVIPSYGVFMKQACRLAKQIA